MGKRLAQLIIEGRQAQRWSQTELAEKMGVDRAYIAQLETGRINLPRVDRMKKLEQLLGISRSEMLQAAGRMDKDTTMDVRAALQRIKAMPDLNDRIIALKNLPPDIQDAIQVLAMDMMRQAIATAPEPERQP